MSDANNTQYINSDNPLHIHYELFTVMQLKCVTKHLPNHTEYQILTMISGTGQLL